jgi:hypothetical protein
MIDPLAVVQQSPHSNKMVDAQPQQTADSQNHRDSWIQHRGKQYNNRAWTAHDSLGFIIHHYPAQTIVDDVTSVPLPPLEDLPVGLRLRQRASAWPAFHDLQQPGGFVTSDGCVFAGAETWFQGMRASSGPMPQMPVMPENMSPAPMKAQSPIHQG